MTEKCVASAGKQKRPLAASQHRLQTQQGLDGFINWRVVSFAAGSTASAELKDRRLLHERLDGSLQERGPGGCPLILVDREAQGLSLKVCELVGVCDGDLAQEHQAALDEHGLRSSLILYWKPEVGHNQRAMELMRDGHGSQNSKCQL